MDIAASTNTQTSNNTAVSHHSGERPIVSSPENPKIWKQYVCLADDCEATFEQWGNTDYSNHIKQKHQQVEPIRNSILTVPEDIKLSRSKSIWLKSRIIK